MFDRGYPLSSFLQAMIGLISEVGHQYAYLFPFMSVQDIHSSFSQIAFKIFVKLPHSELLLCDIHFFLDLLGFFLLDYGVWLSIDYLNFAVKCMWPIRGGALAYSHAVKLVQC